MKNQISEVKVDTTPIIIPMNKAGERVFDVFRRIAERHLTMAREAVEKLISEHFPNAEKVEEMALFDCKYNAVYESYGGIRHSVTYDYLENKAYLEA